MHRTSHLALLLGLPLLALGAAAEIDETGRRLLTGNRLEDAQQAVRHYEARVAAAPDSYDARLGLARALAMTVAIRTNGNLPLFDGLQDTPANRAIWAKDGARALEHARKALALRPDSVDAAAVVALAYMFHASSQGIIASILGGTAGEFRTNAQRVIDMDPAHDAAIGHTLMAGFYAVAPWPVGDSDKAHEHYEAAARLAPDSVRNQYSLGVYWAREGEEERARPYFERALERPCSTESTNSERLLCDFIKRESRRALATL